MMLRLGMSLGSIKRRAFELKIWHARWSEQSREAIRKEYQRVWDSKREVSRQRYRAKWMSIIACSSGQGRSQISRLNGSVYKFLMAHDRDWLDQVTPVIKRRKSAFKRDDGSGAALAILIDKTANVIRSIIPPKRVTKRAIARALGKTDLQRSADTFPESVHALTTVVETKAEFEVRRREWSEPNKEIEEKTESDDSMPNA